MLRNFVKFICEHFQNKFIKTCDISSGFTLGKCFNNYFIYSDFNTKFFVMVDNELFVKKLFKDLTEDDISLDLLEDFNV